MKRSPHDRIVGIDLSEVAIDGSQHKAPSAVARRNGLDELHGQGRSGWKWSLLTDRHGIPVGWTIDAANRNDCQARRRNGPDRRRR
ncbi:MAG: hypothetical protein R2726_16540 [Acidimicrobiales bacterium]